MTTRKTEGTSPVDRRRPVQADPEAGEKLRDADVVHARLKANDVLSIDDGDFGGDPYNSTGRFTALKAD